MNPIELNPMKITNTSESEPTVYVDLPPSRRMLFFEDKSYFVSWPRIRVRIDALLQEYVHGDDKFDVFDMRLCFMNHLEEVVPPYLPNIFDDFRVCCPKPKTNVSIEDLVKEQIQLFFSSSFNVECIGVVQAYYPELVDGFNETAEEDEQDLVLKNIFNELFQIWSDKTKADSKWVPKNLTDINQMIFDPKAIDQYKTLNEKRMLIPLSG